MEDTRKFPYIGMDAELKKKYLQPLTDSSLSIFFKTDLTRLFFIAAAYGAANDIKISSKKRDPFRVYAQLSLNDKAFIDCLAAKYFDNNLEKLKDGREVARAVEEYANGGAKLLYDKTTKDPESLAFDVLDMFRKIKSEPIKV